MTTVNPTTRAAVARAFYPRATMERGTAPWVMANLLAVEADRHPEGVQAFIEGRKAALKAARAANTTARAALRAKFGPRGYKILASGEVQRLSREGWAFYARDIGDALMWITPPKY